MEYQSIVFEKIKNLVVGPNDYIDRIADALNISRSAVYKRINGETRLSVDDLILLMREFNISFDDIVFKEND